MFAVNTESPLNQLVRACWIYILSDGSGRLLWEQDSSLTRQFTDTDFGASSPTELKTVHRHF